MMSKMVLATVHFAAACQTKLMARSIRSPSSKVESGFKQSMGLLQFIDLNKAMLSQIIGQGQQVHLTSFGVHFILID